MYKAAIKKEKKITRKKKQKEKLTVNEEVNNQKIIMV